jgi:hypothetical protein
MSSRKRPLDRRAAGGAVPRQYADGSDIPPELLAQVPRERPVSYLGGRDHVRAIALEIFGELPTLAHAVVVTDVLGGVHGVRCFARDRGLRLDDVGDLVIEQIEDLTFAAHVLYLSHGDGVTSDLVRTWNSLRVAHGAPPFLTDAFIVSPERGRIWSLADRFAVERRRPRDN